MVYLSDDDLRAKIESVRAYPSQVPLLFGDDAAMEARLRGYALHVGGQDPAERLWMPEG